MPADNDPGALAGATGVGESIAERQCAPNSTAPIIVPEAVEMAAADLLIRLDGAPVVVGFNARGTIYTTLGGKRLPHRVVEHLIQTGRLSPCGDGLLPDCSQTLRGAS